MDNTRQNKVSRLLLKEAANYFLHNAGEFPGAMVSVSEVRITPDLSEARIFVSIFPQTKRKEIFDLIDVKTKDIRYAIGKEVRHQLRIVPNLIFMMDNSLDYAERINELLEKDKNLHSETPENQEEA
ncbi:MAG: 30S ribosome-binding factor RbfA [Bacteroidales bacterium]|nr:30S ribosome-binding factor RbfA [Bacteroidales bacterium]MCQ2253693.1 30S ribosome-binding factor RbfA [Bacteroidales bacterium]